MFGKSNPSSQNSSDRPMSSRFVRAGNGNTRRDDIARRYNAMGGGKAPDRNSPAGRNKEARKGWR